MYTGLSFGRDTQNEVKTWVHRTKWRQMFTGWDGADVHMTDLVKANLHRTGFG